MQHASRREGLTIAIPDKDGVVERDCWVGICNTPSSAGGSTPSPRSRRSGGRTPRSSIGSTEGFDFEFLGSAVQVSKTLTHRRTYTHKHVHTYTRTHIHTYTHTYIYIYIHTHTLCLRCGQRKLRSWHDSISFYMSTCCIFSIRTARPENPILTGFLLLSGYAAEDARGAARKIEIRGEIHQGRWC